MRRLGISSHLHLFIHLLLLLSPEFGTFVVKSSGRWCLEKQIRTCSFGESVLCELVCQRGGASRQHKKVKFDWDMKETQYFLHTFLISNVGRHSL